MPRPRIWRASSRRFATTFPKPRARSASPPATPAPRPRWWIPAAIAAGLLLALGVVGWQLRQRDYFWKNPLAGATSHVSRTGKGPSSTRASRRDGKFVAFLSDRDGPYDAWVTQVGSGEFLNLTKGRDPTLAKSDPFTTSDSPATEPTSGFGPNSRTERAQRLARADDRWGSAPFLPSAVEAAWSPDHNRIALLRAGSRGSDLHHRSKRGNPRKICVDKPGIHQHYVAWSPDGAFVYFARGIPPDQMDIWRVSSAGGVAERLTHHNSRVAYPRLLDDRTLIYIFDAGGRLRFRSVRDGRRQADCTSGQRRPRRIRFGRSRAPTAGDWSRLWRIRCATSGLCRSPITSSTSPA